MLTLRTDSKPAVPEPPIPQKTLRPGDMVIGASGRLGKPVDSDFALANCIRRGGWQTMFCVEDITWPPAITQFFQTSGVFFGNGQAITQYRDAKAVQYHVLFPSHAFDRLARHLKLRFGAPTEVPEIWTAMLASPRRFNRAMRWRVAAEDGGQVILEIREIDDLRWSSPPDDRHGVIRLFHTGTEPVFRTLTTADLLLMRVRQGQYRKAETAE